MWNYNFVIPNIILLLTFLLFYFSQPHIPISRNRSFLRVLFVEIFVIFTDVVATLCLEDFSAYPRVLHIALNDFFFAGFILRTYFFFHFTFSLFRAKSQRTKREMFWGSFFMCVCLLIVLANFAFPTLFIIDQTGYHRGFLYNIIYVCAFFYLALTFSQLLENRKKMLKHDFLSAVIFNAILLLGYTVRFLFPQYLIMDLFCLLAIIIMYLSFENSALYLESRTGAFSMESLSALLEERVGKNNSLILGILLHNYNDMREIYSGTQIDSGIALIAENLRKTYPALSLFYIHSGRFVLVGNSDAYNVDSLKKEIRARFTKPWKSAGDEMELYLDVRFIEVSKDLCIVSADNMLHALLTAFNNSGIVSDSDMVISKETLVVLEKNTGIKRAVRRAVEEKSVEMFLQPLVEVGTHRLVGAEALARIRDADGSLLPPGVFIPIAEKNGHINNLGEQMFEKACAFVRDHDLEAMGISWINVNLSPLQFLQSDLSSRFAAILEKYDVSAEKIHLEITEEAMIDYALLQKQIQSMKNTGFEFVLDDFGSGYSNVTRLKQYPFINIKLDMEIVWDYFKNYDQILPALINAFKHMGFSITAEGIENKNMADEMQKLGCDYLQGFYFSRPLAVSEFIQKYTPSDTEYM